MKVRSPGAKRKLPVVSSRWTPDLLEAVAIGESHVLGPLLSRGEPTAVIEAATQAADRAAELARAAIAREPPDPPIACRAGCSSCCSSKVLVTAPEVLRIAEHLRASLTPSALTALLERVRLADRQTRGLSRVDRVALRLSCPLLEDGRCSIYVVWPLVCKGWTSLDVGACERHFQAPAEQPTAPVYAPAYELANAVLAGLGKACFDAGLDGTPLELIAALRIALERPNAVDRWLRRLPVFAQARDAEWMSQHGR